MNQINWNKAIANIGDIRRIRQVMERAEKGEKLTIGFIGGSITQGSLSSSPRKCYAYLVYQWWCEQFPNAEIKYLNAGIGATTSEFGCARVKDDLLAFHPDFVIVEFSVNDESTEHFLETYEGLVRKIYGDVTRPAVLLVHNVYYHNGANAQVMHASVGRHYHLPSISMQSSIYPEVVSGRIKRRDITPDDLHPNDLGHEMVASAITGFLTQIQEGRLQGDTESAEMDALPHALTENAYENSVRIQNRNPEVRMDGFEADTAEQKDITDCFKHGWTASNVGDTISFDVTGSCFSVQYRKSVKKPAPVAAVRIDDDREHEVKLDANFQEDWGDKLELTVLAEHIEEKKHHVVIQIIEAHSDDAVPFYLVSLIASCH